MFHAFGLGLRADGGVLASRSGALRETIGWANAVGARLGKSISVGTFYE
jgi:hypothetical protein